MLAGQIESDGLKELALQRFKAQLKEDWPESELVDCIEELYLNENEHCLLLRPAIIPISRAYFLRGSAGDTFIGTIQKIPEFRADLMGSSAQK
jgi:hypothetical protein